MVHKSLAAVTAAWFAFALAAPLDGVAGELDESAADPSAFTTVIDARAYDDRFATVEEVLDQAPGVRIQRFGGLGAYSTASIRGSKSEQVLVLLDGVRLNSSTRGSVDLSTLPLRQVERIEVIRGGSTRYGSDAVGGVISITTRRPESAELAIDASLMGGSNETFGGDVSLSGGGERAQGLVSYSRLSSENDFRFEVEDPDGGPTQEFRRLNADFAEDAGLLRGALATSSNSSLQGTLDLYRQVGGEPGSIEGRVRDGSTDEQVSCATADERAERAVGRLEWQHRRLLRGAFALGAGVRAEESELHDPDGACLFIQPIVTGGSDRAEWNERETSADARWRATPFSFGAFELAGQTSASVRYATVDASDAELHRRTTGLFSIQPELSFLSGQLRFFPAVGLELANTSEGLARKSASSSFVAVQPRDENAWLPSVGAILELAPGWRAKANWRRVFRRPSFTELFHPDWAFIRGNPELQSEKGWSADAGFELAAPGAGAVRDLSFEVDFFQRELDQGIEWLLNTNNAYMPLNTGRTRVLGVEGGLGARVFERLTLQASYTWSDARFLDDSDREVAFDSDVDKFFPHVPEHALDVQAKLAVGAFEPWVELRWETEVTYQVGRAERAGDSFQVDAGVILRAFDHFALSVEAANLTREQRFDSLGQPLPRQTLWLFRVRGDSP